MRGKGQKRHFMFDRTVSASTSFVAKNNKNIVLDIGSYTRVSGKKRSLFLLPLLRKKDEEASLNLQFGSIMFI